MVVIRDVVLFGLMGLVVREVMVPRLDVVRRDGVDDPAGGELDGAPDATRGRRHLMAARRVALGAEWECGLWTAGSRVSVAAL